jgi:hypothetical protein
MKRLSRVLLGLTLVAVACSGDSTSPAANSIAGGYVLQSVNGDPLPFIVVQIGADKIEVLNETVTLSDGGTFTQQGSIRVTESGTVETDTYAEAGTYTRSGTALNLVFSDGSAATGTVSSDNIIVALSGLSLVYRK